MVMGMLNNIQHTPFKMSYEFADQHSVLLMQLLLVPDIQSLHLKQKSPYKLILTTVAKTGQASRVSQYCSFSYTLGREGESLAVYNLTT